MQLNNYFDLSERAQDLQSIVTKANRDVVGMLASMCSFAYKQSEESCKRRNIQERVTKADQERIFQLHNRFFHWNLFSFLRCNVLSLSIFIIKLCRAQQQQRKHDVDHRQRIKRFQIYLLLEGENLKTCALAVEPWLSPLARVNIGGDKTWSWQKASTHDFHAQANPGRKRDE